MAIRNWLRLRRSKREAQSERSKRTGPLLMEPLEPRLLLSADLIGSGTLALLEVSPVEQAIQIDLGQQGQQIREGDPALVLSYLAQPEDRDDAADEGALTRLAQSVSASADWIPRGQDHLEVALEASPVAEGPACPLQDESSCLIGVDQQDEISSEEGSPLEARAPPTWIAPHLPGLQLVDPDPGNLVGQTICLDFDGAQSVFYDGPVRVGSFDIPAFRAPAALSGEEETIILASVAELNQIYAGSGVTFTAEKPAPGTAFSVIYVGGDDSAFGAYGSFLGLAEHLDVGNADRSDKAFVFSDNIIAAGHSALSSLIADMSNLLCHEAGHLLGYEHDGEDLYGGVLSAVAALKATNPVPTDGSLHADTWVNLSWTPGDSAVSHDVYLGESSADVDAGTGGTFRGNQTSTSFLVGLSGYPYPDGLDPDTTYYWRIDEVDGVTTYEGDVWSFRTVPYTAYYPHPYNGAWSVDRNANLSWDPGYGAQLHTVYFGDNFDDVNNATGGLPQTTTTYDPGVLAVDTTYYWRVDEFDGTFTYKGDVWSFTTEGPETYYSDYGQSRVHEIVVDAGVYNFEIDGIGFYKNTEWYVDDVYTGVEEDDHSGLFAIDPDYTHTFTSRTTKIQGVVYDSDWFYEEDHTWYVTVRMPDLAPYQPSGWTDEIVISTNTGDHTDDSPLYDDQDLYIDWAVVNDGSTATTSSYGVALYVDGLYRTSWSIPPPHNIGGSWYRSITDYNLGTLSADQHTLEIRVDYLDTVHERDESASDNNYSHQIVVLDADFGSQQTISTMADGAASVYACDLDGDGDNDVLSASWEDDKIAWYENTGGGTFGSQQIISTLADWASSVYACDLDGDGDNDVLSASRSDDKIAWYENLGGGIFGGQQIISLQADGPHSVYSCDLDGDGDNDILSASAIDNTIAWYENIGGGAFGLRQVIGTQATGAPCVYACDLDGDGDSDVLSASPGEYPYYPGRIIWYRNLGSGTFGSELVISTEADGAWSVYACDLDGDGDNDVLSANWDLIAWYENFGGGSFGALRIVGTGLYGACSVYACDLDGDGDNDVLSASREDDKIAWYMNLGSGAFGSQQVISANADSARSVYACDLDGDGDNDVLSASAIDDKIAWYENLRSATGSPEMDVEVDGTENVHQHDFGVVDVGQTASQVFTVRNEGDAVLVVSQAAGLFSPFNISPVNGSSSTDDWRVPPGGTQAFTVSFSPVDTGTYSDTLVLTNNDSDEGSYQIVVQGTYSSEQYTGQITGQGRFEKIAGVSSIGYQYLYEWDLFLSPADNSIVGPSRRLGAPPEQPPIGDGFYYIDNLPAGIYSVYVNQPDFFASPKVVSDVQIVDGQQTVVNVDLDVDYSTYFRDLGQWTDWQSTWFQTFSATGTSVRGVSWVMSGFGLYDGDWAEISILEDNGDPDVRNWTLLGTKRDDHIDSDSDEWVRWPSEQILLTPGKQYAVEIWVNGGCAIYKRDKDGSSYPHGWAYDLGGNPQNFDLNVTVFVDRNDQMVTHTRLNPGPGQFDSALSDTRWGQTFVATGASLAAVDLFAASDDADFDLTWRVLEGGPAGLQIGPTKTTQGAYFASTADLVGVSYNPGEISLVPGQTYCIEVTDITDFAPYTQEPWNSYADGTAFRNDAATGHDLAMTIMEYKLPEITVSGNGVVISDGDTTPSTADHTDFGSTPQGGATISRTFRVHNDGGSTLTLGAVSLPAGFTLTEGLVGSLAPSASDTFTVRLDTAAAGVKSGDVSFVNNDGDENPFNFRIAGTVVAPEIDVELNGTDNVHSYAFGVADIGQAVSQEFVVRNEGDAILMVTQAEGLTSPFSIAPVNGSGGTDDWLVPTGGTYTFAVSFSPDSVGDYSGTLVLTSSDADEGSYQITFQGTCMAFGYQRIISSEGPMSSVYACDLDGDGDNDVLSAGSSTAGSLAWYENLGNDTFGDLRAIRSLGGGATSVYACDLDGDGDNDVLSTSLGYNTIDWCENLGGGVFGSTQAISTQVDYPRSVYACDLDGDGDNDVLSASQDDNKIAWYENLGSGAFGAQQVISTLANGAFSVYACDLDGDSDSDVLSASRDDNKIAWYENLGSGAFGGQQVISTQAHGTRSVYAADLDGDGDNDVLSASLTYNTITWHENLGGGTFGVGHAVSTQADAVHSVYACDVDGDSDNDVLSGSYYGMITWYENAGSGTFDSGQTIDIQGLGVRSVYACDLDGDGDNDVLSASETDPTVAWYENLSSPPTGSPQIDVEVDGRDDVHAYAFGALEIGQSASQEFVLRNEGDADLVVTQTAGLISPFRVSPVNRTESTDDWVIPAGGTWTFTVSFSPDRPGDHGDILVLTSNDSDEGSYQIEYTGAGPLFGDQQVINYGGISEGSFYGCDLDGDGDNDVVSATSSDQRMAWYENLGGGVLGGQQIIGTFPDLAWSVYPCDLDGDSDNDLLFTSALFNEIAWYRNRGSGFSEVDDRQVISNLADRAMWVYACDLDGDGDNDVLRASGNEIAWHENLGEGVFGDYQIISTLANGAQFGYACDLDGDGDNDVLSGSAADDTIAWYENLSGASFASRQVISTQVDDLSSIYACDVDGDGDNDVLSASQNDDTIAWYENLGGMFGVQQVISTQLAGPSSVYACDLDGDGDNDVLSTSQNDDTIAWYENLGSMFGAQQIISTQLAGPSSVYACDLDSDGDNDVLSAESHKLAWFENLESVSGLPEMNVEVSGTGDVHNHSFGVVGIGQSISQDLLVRNEGNADLVVTQAAGLVSPFSISEVNKTESTDDWVIPAGGAHTFTVSFFADSFGSYSDTLVLTSNDPDEGSYEIQFSGTVAGQLDFGDAPFWSAPALLDPNADLDSGADRQPQVATDGAGNWVCVWFSEDSLGGTIGTDGDILVSHSTDDGQTWTGAVPLNANAATDAAYDVEPQVTTDGLGNWVAAWVSYDSLGDTIGTDADVLVSRSTDVGQTWTSPMALNTNAGSDSGYDSKPQVVYSGDGAWLAVWESNTNLGGATGWDADILISRSTDDGQTWTDPVVLNVNAYSDSGDDFRPQIITDGVGNWIAVWESNDDLSGSIGVDSDILVSHSTDDGLTWTDPASLNANAQLDTGEDARPQIVADGMVVVAVWQSDDTLGNSIGADGDILISRSTDFGHTWSAPMALNANAGMDTEEDWNAQIATDGLGTWIVVWITDDDLGGTIGTDADVMVSYSSDDGQTWTALRPLKTTADTDYWWDEDPQVATNGAGRWMAVWQSTHSPDGTTNTDPDILFATDRYRVLEAHNAARHGIVANGPWLGDQTDSPDAELDGQPDPHAQGDDLAGDHDDENGVVIPVLIQGKTSQILVEVNDAGSGTGGVLEAWIDWDGDGSWEAGEQVYAGHLDAGTHAIEVTPPWDTVDGETFGRFRISSAGGLTPEGLAPDGEVEDHAIVIIPTAEIHGSKWHDVNGDGLWDANEPGLEGWTIYLDGAVNILANGGFEDGVAAPWRLSDLNGQATLEVVSALADAAVPEDPVEGDFSLHVVVPQAGTQFWDVALSQEGQYFEAGKKYTLSAYLKSRQGTLLVNFKPELSQDPWTGYGEQSFTVTEEWAEYSTTTPVFTENVSPANIRFHIGYTAGDFWIDGVRFYEGDYRDGTPNQLLDADEPYTVTDEYGHYSFMGLSPGTYTVAEVLQDGWEQTAPQGIGTHVVPLGRDQSVEDVNFGNRVANSSPIISNNTGITVAEGGSEAIDNTELEVTDADNTPIELQFTLTVVPTNGFLQFDGTTLSVGDTFTQADINDGLLSYEHDGSETVSDSFEFTVSDNLGGSIGNTTFSITVTPVNDAPVLAAIGDRTVDEGTELAFTATATDVDIPAQALTFSLDAGAPAGASIDPSTGVFTWTPSAAQGPGAYPVTVRVTDDGVPNLDDEETITITVTETAMAARALPDYALAGETIDVVVVFVASEDDFNSVGLADDVPSGWTIAVDSSWCTPTADQANVMGDQVQYAWYGPYSAGYDFTAKCSVTVPADAAAGTYSFSGELGYKIGSGERVFTAIGGEDVIQVVEGNPVAGITREVSGALLPSVAVTLDSGETSLSDENGNYELIASEIRNYDVTASMSGFRDRTRVVSVSGIGPDHSVTCDFAGSTALIPNAPDIWYALDCVNLWLFPPNEEIGLDIWTALDVVNAWLYPIVGSAALELGMAQSPDQMDPLDLSDEETVIEDLGAPAPMRSLPASPVDGGDIFEVTVHFVADDDNFNAIGLTDNVPSGWTVEVDRSLCTPSADQANVVGDQVQYAWYGPYSAGWDCTARYRVTVPVDAAVGTYSFSGELGYRIGGAARIFVPVVGDSTVTISGNSPPVLAAIGDKNVDEGVELTFTATATDADTPAQNLTFTLGTGAPAGATIDSSTGIFNWTPTEAQGPGSYSLDVVVTDDGTPPLSDWETITITVNEVNVPPSAVDDEATVAEGGTVEIAVLANDSDVDSTLLYSNVTIVSTPGNGSAVVEAAGIRYTHDGSETVSDSFMYQIEDGDGGSDTATVTITVTSGDVLLRVDSLEAIPSGFLVYFNGPAASDVLNLYDTQANLYGPADFTVVGNTVGLVAGSLICSEDGTTVRFIKTGGPLEPGAYTVTLRSAADGFTDSEGNPLDGDADGTPGGDYVTTFVVESSTARLLSLPDFTRGPGQVVNVPATGSGIPVTISDGTGLQGIDFVFEYDPALLTVTGVSLSSEMPGDWAITYNLSTPGMITVWLYAPTASLPSGELSLVEIQATIPEDAPYGSIQLVGLSDIQIDEGVVAAQCDGGVQVVAYLGDGTGNYRYSALDAAYLARVGVGLDSGFAAYPLKDPMLIGDVTGNGHMSALDAAYLARKGVGLDVPQIPDLPDGLPPIVPSGRDPLVSILDDLTASQGETLTVAVSILDDATDLFAVEPYLEYDTEVFDLDTSDVRTGDLTGDWVIIANVDDAAGTIVAQLFDANPLSGGTGSVVEIDFHVRADAPYGPTVLDLTNDCMLNEGQLVLTLDDGLVTILADDTAPAAAVVNVTALPGATTVANGRTVTHTTPSSIGSLESMSIIREGSHRPGWQAVNLQRRESASFRQMIWRPWVFEGGPGIRRNISMPGRADAEIGWLGGMPARFGSLILDDYIDSIYANYV